MKNISITLILSVFFGLCKSYGEISTTITKVLVNNQTYVENCGNIDFGTNTNNSLIIYFKLTKQKTEVVGIVEINIFIKGLTSSSEYFRSSLKVLPTSWNDSTEYIGSIGCNIGANEVEVTGSYVYIKSTYNQGVETNSCRYPISKTPTPTFEVSPNSISLSCNDKSFKKFSVKNVYNSPGTLKYEWHIGHGWNYNGAPVSNIVTTTNSIELTAFSYPPNPVKVIPILNGKKYPQLTTNVGLTSFNPPESEIAGANVLCSTDKRIYEVKNLPLNHRWVSSWSTSNEQIATIRKTSSYQAELSVKQLQMIDIHAIITNSCGQNKRISKAIWMGKKPIINLRRENYDSSYPIDYDVVIKDAQRQRINSVTWQKVSGRGSISQNARIYSANVGGGVREWTLFARVIASNRCGSTTKNFSASGGGRPPCDRRYEIAKRPGDRYELQRRPCPDKIRSYHEKEQPEQYLIKAYDITGKELQKSKTIDLSTLKPGIYILKAIVNNEVVTNKVSIN